METRIASLFTLILLFYFNLSNAQSNLNTNGQTHTIGASSGGNRTGTYEDFVIPTNLNFKDHIEFYLKGGDGGSRRVPNQCRRKGGQGASVVVRFSVGPGQQLLPGGTIRFIVGKKGERETGNGTSGAGGGGGTAVLYRSPNLTGNPGCNRTIHGDPYSLPSNCLCDTSSCWVILGVAGGGAGAYLSGLCNGGNGKGGNNTTNGLSADGTGGDGGVNGRYGGNGGGGLIGGNGPWNGQGGGFTGGNGNASKYTGGFGYGGGGGGDDGGRTGAGGGYSGGGGGFYHKAGGGGSFANIGAANRSLTAGDIRFHSEDGYITYQFMELTNNTPVALCQDVQGYLDEHGEYELTALPLDNGSYDPKGRPITLRLFFVATNNPRFYTQKFTFHCGNLNRSSQFFMEVHNGVDSAICQANATVDDTLAPAVSCQNSLQVILDDNTSYEAQIAPSDVANGASDNCTAQTDIVFSLDKTDFNCNDIGSQVVTLFASDEEDNVSSCTANIQVKDTVPPIAICRNVTVNVGADGTVTKDGVFFLSNVSDVCGGLASITPAQKTYYCQFQIFDFFNVTVTDHSGNSTSCRTNVWIQDNRPPDAKCQNAIVGLDQNGDGHLAVSDIDNASSDNCGGISSYAVSPSTFDCSHLGISQTVTLSLSDAKNNTSSCTASVTIEDHGLPNLTCPRNIVLANSLHGCGRTVTYSITRRDNCTSTFSQTDGSGLSSGDYFPVGTTTQSYELNDNFGNGAACSFTVTIEDQEDPYIQCPSNKNETASPGACYAESISYSLTHFDNCASTLSQTDNSGLSSGDDFPVGSTTQSYTATDASGRTASCSFIITVTETEDPIISCPANIITDAPGDCPTVVTFQVNVSDNCSATITQTAGLASGDLFPIGTTSNSFTATDPSGNTASCSFNITVNDITPPVLICPANQTLNSPQGFCVAPFLYFYKVMDNCPVNTQNIIQNKTYHPGTTVVTHTATDAYGNVGSCSFMVTVEDRQKPSIICVGDVHANSEQGKCDARVHWANRVFAFDNCGANVQQTDATGLSSGSRFPVGSTQLEFTATDAAGNTAKCGFKVIVNDRQNPNISCHTPISLSVASGQCGRQVTYIEPMGSDNCMSTTALTVGLGSGSFFPVGTTTEAYTVTDASGNTASCSFDISITDDEAPQITLNSFNGDTDLYFCEGQAYHEFGATATDNCDPHVNQNIHIDASGVNANQMGSYQVLYTVTDVYGNSAQAIRNVFVRHTPAQLAPQNCGSCNQIRFDFCEGEASPDLNLLLQNNANHENGVSKLWYADTNGSQGSPIAKPTVNTASKNTQFYWVSQYTDGCEGGARRVRVRVRKTSTVVWDLPAIGCGAAQIDLAAWVSDSRKIATGYTFYDSNPDIGNPTAIGNVTATKGAVNSGQYAVVSLPASSVTYYAVASNNTGCQVTGSDILQVGASASLDSVPDLTVNSGDLVSIHFNSPNATYILWLNHSSFNNPYIGLVGNFGMGNLIFTAANITSAPQTATLRAIAYLGNCAGEVRDFSITVAPGASNRQSQNSLQLAANKINAHDVKLNWQIDYEFALTHIEIEKQMNDGEWEMIDHQDVDQHGVGSHYNVTLQDGSYLDRSGMGNLTKYRLKLIHADGRAIWSQEVEVNFDYYNTERFTLYPNPSNGRFNLRAAGPLEGEWRYKLSDQLGRTILIGKLQGSETAFDISRLPTAHYFLLFTSPEGKQYLQRVVKN